MKKILIFLPLILMASLVLADVSQVCSDNQTIRINQAIFENNTWTNFSTYSPCPYGCDEIRSSCLPDPYDVSAGSIALLILLFACSVLLFWIHFRVPDEAWQLFYYFTALLFLLAALMTAVSFIANLNLSGSMGAIEWMIYVPILAIFISFVYLILKFVDDLMIAVYGKNLAGKHVARKR